MDISENVDLSKYSTFKVGGMARYFVEVKNVQSIIDAFDFASTKQIPIFILGGGSNILIGDNGFPGLVVKVGILGITEEYINSEYVRVIAGAGEVWDNLVKKTVEKGLYGLENLSLIPGTVGASPVQNIGAYGREVKDSIEYVEVFDFKLKKTKIFKQEECEFGYRTSVFKRKESKSFLITNVAFKLSKKSAVDLKYKDLEIFFKESKNIPSLIEVRNAVIDIRTKKMPNMSLFGTAGSFWKNPVVSKKQFEELKSKYPLLPGFETNSGFKLPLAFILDSILNLRGYSNGNAFLHNNQPLILVTKPGAKAKDIDLLAEDVENKVFTVTGLKIEREVEYIERA